MENKKEIVIGIDIGGTNTEIGAVDSKGNILCRGSISTKAYKNLEDYLSALFEKTEMLLNTLSGNYVLKGIGIGAPNGNIFRGPIEYAANLNWKGVLPIAEQIKKKFHVPVKVTNDANAAALGEKLYGKGLNSQNFIMITLGTGLGSGIVSEGNLLYGHSGFAGELGHVIVKENGRQCGCGRKGCLETYVSATGLITTVKELLNESEEASMMRTIDVSKISAKDVSGFAEKGDKLALNVFDFTASVLGKALADFTAVLSPEYIFFFGGLANAGDLLLKPTEKYMNENVLNIYKDTVKLEISGLKNGEAAISGAAALIWDEIN